MNDCIIEIEQFDTAGNVIRYTSGFGEEDIFYTSDPDNPSLESHTDFATIDGYKLTGDQWRYIDAEEFGLEKITRDIIYHDLTAEEAICDFFSSVGG